MSRLEDPPIPYSWRPPVGLIHILIIMWIVNSSSVSLLFLPVVFFVVEYWPMYNELPLILVEYPDSETDYLKTRYVRVESMDSTHLRGHEFTTLNPSNADEGKYKTYLLAKIVQGGVHLIKFQM